MTIQTQVKGKTRLIFALLIVLAVLVVLDDYRGWRFLWLGLLGAWWLSRWWAHELAKKLRLQREMRFGWAQVGDRLEQRFTLVNNASLPAAWVELEDRSDLPGYRANLATGIEGRHISQWRKRGVCQQRGLYTLGPTTLHTSDPLGLYQVTIHDPRHVSLLVTPPIIPLPQIEVAPGGRAGEGRPRPYTPEQTVSAQTTRPYVPGDNLHRVHWRTTARRDALYVRTFESRPSGDWWIMLDFEESVQAGEGPQSTLEHAVVLAASLADRGLRMGRAVGLAAHGERLVWLPPRQGEARRWEILHDLALLKPGQRPLEHLLGLLEHKFSADASLVIITPNTSAGWLQGLLPLIWKGAVPTVLLLDPAAFGGQSDFRAASLELARWGIHHERITPELLDRQEARPGHEGEMDWRVTPTGRAVLVHPSHRAAWKRFE